MEDINTCVFREFCEKCWFELKASCIILNNLTVCCVCMNSELSSALQPVPPAAAVSGVNYSLNDTHSSRGCPCRKMRPIYDIKKNTYTTYVSYSAVNISVFAINRAGYSPPAVIQVPAATAADLKSRLKCMCVCLSVSHIMYIYP